ncbi:hypothetical protein Fmac_027141 [Flemingia macrophylla]|uniref:Uncharacterized protein n=1 Tax=Flemingia macrophylla TaxID=520843 RepID=A0ABD1LGW3_9FABA
MADAVVSLAQNHLLPKIVEAIKMLRDLPKEVADIRDELASFQEFINDAHKATQDEKDDDKRDTIKERVKRLREAAFRMEDAIDECMILEENNYDDPRCAALLCEVVDFLKTLIPRLQAAYNLQDVKSLVCAEREAFERHFPLERSSLSRGKQNVPFEEDPWLKLRMDPLLIEEAPVGLDEHTLALKNLLTEGPQERTVISVVGIPGVGKSTLAKQVFDKVHKNFECHALITVSQYYTVKRVLTDVLVQLCKEKMEDPPQDVSTMDRMSLIQEVKKRLRNKRNEKVGKFCERSSYIKVHKLEEPLDEKECFRLFCNKAFKYGFDGDCPEELKDISLEIVRKCKGLPLAIVVVGGLLSQKDKNAPEWKSFSQNLSLELERNSDLNSITKILSLSYDDLSHNLRSCLLYFGMYPEDYEVKSSRLIKQWVVEGFVKHVAGKSLKEVAQQKLSELIRRNLVQVSSFTIDGKVKRCRVHDLIHDMIVKKAKETCFCHSISEHNQSLSSEILRRLTIVEESDDLIRIERSHIRSILLFTKKGLSQQFMGRIFEKYMSLKVLDFEDRISEFFYVSETLGNLIHLKYLNFRKSNIRFLPKSIGKLHNLEILDVRDTLVDNLPKEISNLRKLRHLLGISISCDEKKEFLGSLTLLEKIHILNLDGDRVEIRELEKLKQLRDLRVRCFKAKQTDALCFSIDKMKFLEVLHIDAGERGGEIIDLPLMSSLSTLRKLFLRGILLKIPNWISQLQNLLKLSLKGSELTDDPLKSLKDIPNLLFLSIGFHAYEGETLHFQDGWFRQLKELELEYLVKLNSIFIDRGALPSLKKLLLTRIPLKKVPTGIQYLKNLEVLKVKDMSIQFEQSIANDGGQDHWMIQHVPHVQIQVSLITKMFRGGRLVPKYIQSPNFDDEKKVFSFFL